MDLGPFLGVSREGLKKSKAVDSCGNISPLSRVSETRKLEGLPVAPVTIAVGMIGDLYRTTSCQVRTE